MTTRYWLIEFYCMRRSECATNSKRYSIVPVNLFCIGNHDTDDWKIGKNSYHNVIMKNVHDCFMGSKYHLSCIIKKKSLDINELKCEISYSDDLGDNYVADETVENTYDNVDDFIDHVYGVVTTKLPSESK